MTIIAKHAHPRSGLEQAATPPGRHPRLRLWAPAAALLALLFSACSGPTVPSGHPARAWTRAELDAALDLRALGRITLVGDGTALLGGRLLDPALIGTQAYGRRLNLLQLDPDLVEALPSELARRLIHASAEEILAGLEAYAISPEELRAAQRDGVSTEEFAALAQLAAQRSGDATLLQALEPAEAGR